MTSNPQDRIQIQDLSSNHHHRTEIPNILFLLKLKPVQLAVYLVLKRIAGDLGYCIKSIKKIAEEANVNEKTFRDAKKFLSQTHPLLGKPLILITTRKKNNKDSDTDLIQIVDIWDKNYEHFYKLNKSNNNSCDQNPNFNKNLGGAKNGRGVVPKTVPKEDLREEELYHQSNLSKLRDPPDPPDPDRLIDDFSSKKCEKQNIVETTSCWMTESELEDCIQARGSLQTVKEIIIQVSNWPGRKNDIQDWPNTIKNWKLKNNTKQRVQNNEETGKLIEKKYGNASGCTARVFTDSRKDLKGILFESKGVNVDPIFIAFSDADFERKVKSILIQKKMIKQGNGAK